MSTSRIAGFFEGRTLVLPDQRLGSAMLYPDEYAHYSAGLRSLRQLAEKLMKLPRACALLSERDGQVYWLHAMDDGAVTLVSTDCNMNDEINYDNAFFATDHEMGGADLEDFPAILAACLASNKVVPIDEHKARSAFL